MQTWQRSLHPLSRRRWLSVAGLFLLSCVSARLLLGILVLALIAMGIASASPHGVRYSCDWQTCPPRDPGPPACLPPPLPGGPTRGDAIGVVLAPLPLVGFGAGAPTIEPTWRLYTETVAVLGDFAPPEILGTVVAFAAPARSQRP
jgi:hypothetical protein